MASYRLSPAAEQDLEEIWIYTAHKWSAQQSIDVIRILHENSDVTSRLGET